VVLRHEGTRGGGQQTKLIHTALVTPANVADATLLPDLLHGEETRVWGDQAYRGQADVIHQCAPRAQDCTHRRYRHRDYLDEVERAKNRTKSTVRSKVEHVFGVLKLQFVQSFPRRTTHILVGNLCKGDLIVGPNTSSPRHIIFSHPTPNQGQASL
jgi:IS5 family transposase